MGGGPGDCTGGGGGTGGGNPEFSYIWIANSPEGTVSKIDTMTGVELGRYRTGPDGVDVQPSRTSVNLYGDAAVSNRGPFGGAGASITKIAARTEDCPDSNANGTVDTSTGPADVKPWGMDECVLWNTPMASTDYTDGPRPTAWEGTKEGNCAAPNPRLWVGWYDNPANTGKFHRLDGATGQIVDTVDVPNWTGLDYGPYGGAVDGQGNFWASGWQKGHLVKIDGVTLQPSVYPFPTPPSGQPWSYGMALDQYGNAWIASSYEVAYFDAATSQWGFVSLGHLSIRGVMVDREDRAWFAVDGAGDGFGGCGLGIVDVKTRTVINPLATLAGCVTPVGVSIDVEGYVWIVDQGASQAFKFDPTSMSTVLTVSGLVSPYTYSDMTGAGLDLVTNPPQG
jgi:hypothetical protein